MTEGYVGKTLRNEKDEEFFVLNELSYKNIPCVYAMRITTDDTEGEKTFFQVTTDGDARLVSITSNKMQAALSETLFKDTKESDMPRKIKDDEGIVEYMAYLDEFYKSKVVTIM